MRHVLLHGTPERHELAVPVGDRVHNQLLSLKQKRIELQLRHTVEKIQDSVNRVLRQGLWFAVLVEFSELLLEQLEGLNASAVVVRA